MNDLQRIFFRQNELSFFRFVQRGRYVGHKPFPWMVSYWRFIQEGTEMAAFFGGIFSGSILLFLAG